MTIQKVVTKRTVFCNAGNVVVNGSGTIYEQTLSEVIDPTVLVLLTVLLPIIAIIAVVMYFLPKSKSA